VSEDDVQPYPQIQRLVTIINGISLLGVNEVYNGTKALRLVEWIDAKTLVVTPAYRGTLRVYVQPNVRVEAKNIHGQHVSISKNLKPGYNLGTIIHVPISTDALIFSLGTTNP
jgi:hypothetical protein